MRATPTQLVFGRDALLNVSVQADWEIIRQRKQRMINLNDNCEPKDWLSIRLSLSFAQRICDTIL